MTSSDDDNVFERYSDNPSRLPKGWVTYVENPLTPEATIVSCPLSAAPDWVQAKHANQDKNTTRPG